MNVRCPQCQNSIEVVEELATLDSEVECPSCGSSFNLERETDTIEQEAPCYDRVAHFELLKKLGIGAFGAVWKARDTRLDRIVAVKIPRKSQLDDAETEKFLREARASAQLRHPNIVNVHEVGQDGSKVYIVADLIDGVTLSDWLTGRQLTPREAVELCIKLADAVHHAHECGVIHRDLKPSNVMLNAAGEPFVMDFGLAKRELGEVTMTVEGQIIGTPAYMAPEQARGEGHQVDRRSDVYSLGVLLFELLSGERPFRGNTRMLLHQVLHDEPPSPRRLNAAVPKDLETICLKCLEKDRAKRFPTARDLADELRRYLSGEPILSRPVTSVERLWRWGKRNPVVALLSTSVAALIVFLVVTGPIVYWHEKQLRLDAQSAAADEHRAHQNALRSERAALQARDEALDSQRLALDSWTLLIDVTQQELATIPGAAHIRGKLLTKALQQSSEFSASLADRGSVDRHVMIATSNLAEVFLRIGRSSAPPIAAAPVTSPALTGKGEAADPDSVIAESLRLFQIALTIAERLAAQQPNDSNAQHDLAVTLSRLVDISLQLGQSERADTFLTRKENHIQGWLARRPNDRDARISAAATRGERANLTAIRGDAGKGIEQYKEALQQFRALVAEPPPDRDLTRNLIVCLNNFGELLENTVSVEQALEKYQEALTLTESLAVANPNDGVLQRDLGIAYGHVGSCYRRLGKLAESKSWFDRKYELSRKLANTDPSDVILQNGLSVASRMLAEVLAELGQVEAAEPLFHEALKVSRRLAELRPDDISLQRRFSRELRGLADFLVAQDKYEAALTLHQEALAIRQRLAEHDPDNHDALRWLAIAYSDAGNCESHTGQFAAASEHFQQAQTLFERLAERQPQNKQARRDLAVSLERLGNLELKQGNSTKALDLFARKLEIAERAAAEQPNDTVLQNDWAVALQDHGQALLRLNQPAAALNAYHKRLEVSRRLVDREPENAAAQQDLAIGHRDVGKAFWEMANYSSAIQSYESAIDLLEKLIAADRLADASRSMLAVINREMTNCRTAQVAAGDWDELLRRPPAELATLLNVRLVELSRQQRFADLVPAAQKLREMRPSSADNLYNAACAFSLAANAIGKTSDPLNESQQAERKRLIEAAIESLKESVASGYKDFVHMAKDPDFAALRSQPEYQSLIKSKGQNQMMTD